MRPKYKCCFNHLIAQTCQLAVSKWTNSKGELFRFCQVHLDLMKNVAEDYEETAPNEYRAIKRQSRNNTNNL